MIFKLRYKKKKNLLCSEETLQFEHSATQPDLQRWSMPTFLSKKEGKGGTPKEESIGDYLQEYESQSDRFKVHLNFPKFC